LAKLLMSSHLSIYLQNGFASQIISVSLTTTGRFVRQNAGVPKKIGIVRVQKKKHLWYFI